jgi:C-terminal processing protease CtpA/Prc
MFYISSFKIEFNHSLFQHDDTLLVVSRVALNTPASRALLHEGDTITAINNIDIQNHSHEEVKDKKRGRFSYLKVQYLGC